MMPMFQVRREKDRESVHPGPPVGNTEEGVPPSMVDLTEEGLIHLYEAEC